VWGGEGGSGGLARDGEMKLRKKEGVREKKEMKCPSGFCQVN